MVAQAQGRSGTRGCLHRCFNSIMSSSTSDVALVSMWFQTVRRVPQTASKNQNEIKILLLFDVARN